MKKSDKRNRNIYFVLFFFKIILNSYTTLGHRLEKNFCEEYFLEHFLLFLK